MSVKEFIKKVFPLASFSYLTDDGNFEANGLEANTVPKGVTVLASGSVKVYRKGDYQTHYIVTDGIYTSTFRICAAYPDSGYAEFATSRGSGVVRNDSIEYADFMENTLRSLSSLCNK